MNHKKRMGKLMLAGLAASLTLSITPVQGSTLDTLTQEEKQTEARIASVEVTIGETLASINLKQMEIDDLEAQIVAAEESQSETKLQSKLKRSNTSRKEQLKTRLVALQTSDADESDFDVADSENFADFISRVYVVGQLQAADNEQIESAISEEEKLMALEEQLADEIETVKVAEGRLKSESSALAEELSTLKDILSENQIMLSQVQTEYATEADRLAAEAAQAKADAEAAQAAANAAEEHVTVAESTAPSLQEGTVATQEPESQITDSSVAAVETAPVVTAPTVTEPPASQGKTVTVSATAYSRHEAGLSNFTATGIDLSINPMVIAVDPSVIPLGSIVSVPGYGIAIAGDTGGAIVGNKIDLHMEDLNAALAFGRQTLTITILQ